MIVNIAGVVLAGGQSARMGLNKALLPWGDHTLLQHAVNTLKQTWVCDVFVSGDYPDFKCIEDPSSIRGKGPALAMGHSLQTLITKGYQGVLFVPVDMPLLQVDLLNQLIKTATNTYFELSVLPALLMTLPVVTPPSVHGLLRAVDAQPMPLTSQCHKQFNNINTPEQWQAVILTLTNSSKH